MALQLTPQICRAKVMHRRLFPKVNGFTYRVYYLVLPLRAISVLQLPFITSFRARDHGARNGEDLRKWIDDILYNAGLKHEGEVLLVAMPRVFGYGFNPVSFWLCLDDENRIRAMLYEVNNTFGETHSYLCAHADGRPIEPEDVLTGEKMFHVSPFLPRVGEYRFRVAFTPEKNFGVWIDYYSEEGRKQLLTSMTGTMVPLTQPNMWRSICSHPLLTLKVVTLIHLQALKLFLKGVKYIPLPRQFAKHLSRNKQD